MVKSPLQQLNFQYLWAGQSLLLFSEEIWLVALTWLVLQETGSGFVLGVILMAGAIPSALLSLVGGAISDRFPSHRVATMVAIIDTSLAGLMVVLLWLDIFNIPVLVAMSAIEGTADAFLYPAILATLPRVVKRDQLGQANTLSEGSDQLTDIFGPALAGLSIAAFGITQTFAMGAMITAVGSGLLACVHPLWGKKQLAVSFQPKVLGRDIVEGLRYVWSDRSLRTIFGVVAMLNFAAAGPLIIGCAGLVRVRFGGDVAILGYLEAAAGLGVLLGIFIAIKLDAKHNPTGPIILLTCLLGAGLLALSVIHQVWLAYGMLVLVGLSGALIEIMALIWFQRETAPHLQGRVVGLLIFADVALEPISQAVSGFVSDISLPLLFAAAGVILLGTGLVAGCHSTGP